MVPCDLPILGASPWAERRWEKGQAKQDRVAAKPEELVTLVWRQVLVCPCPRDAEGEKEAARATGSWPSPPNEEL